MIRFITPIFAALAIITTLLYCSSPVVSFPAEAPGTITFIGNAGSDNTFTVNRWKFDQLENLADPTNIKVAATLDMTSITTGWKDLEKNLHKKKEYFNSKKFNTAQVIVEGAALQEDGSYLADAVLSLKGVKRAVPITFTLTGSSPYQLEAKATVMRRKFKFTGNGPKDEVPVMVSATLE